MTKREDIYDTQINPLMAQIIAICGAHDIPFVASFQINDERPARARRRRGGPRTSRCGSSPRRWPVAEHGILFSPPMVRAADWGAL